MYVVLSCLVLILAATCIHVSMHRLSSCHLFKPTHACITESAYGRGAYFAVSAAYSSRNEYAAADPFNKERNIFQCRVLVGQYKLGDQNMRFPPELSSGQRCNSTVDDEKTPQIFVTFSDVQAYPEYRIVFKDS